MKKFFAFLALAYSLILTACSPALPPPVIAHTTYVTTLDCKGRAEVRYFTQQPAECTLESGAINCTTLGGPALVRQGSGGFWAQADSPLLASSSSECYIQPGARELHEWSSNDFDIDVINQYISMVEK